MPFERIEPAQWWHGAEAAPPMPDEPACDAPGAGPSSMPPVVGSRSFTNIPNAPAWVPPAPPPELRVGDRLLGDDGVVSTVDYLPDSRWINAVTAGGGRHGIPAGCVGPPGSGKPWTLLPREAGPDVSDAGVLKAESLPSASDGVGWARIIAARHAHERAYETLGTGDLTAMAAALRAADAVPDPRREALERVAEAAQALVGRADAPTDAEVAQGQQDVRAQWDEMRAATDALAALDREGGA